MSRTRRRGSHRARLNDSRSLFAGARHLIQRPLRLAALVTLAAALSTLVTLTSLPTAIARNSPDLSLRLSPQHPDALLAKAEQVRTSLFALVLQDATSARAPEGTQQQSADTIASLPRASTAGPNDEEPGRLRNRLRELATRVLQQRPRDAVALRMLGEIADTVAETRQKMREAVANSRRETIAAFWLLNDSIERNEAATAVSYAHILLATSPGLSGQVIRILVELATDENGRAAVAQKLSNRPEWRRRFFEGVSQAKNTPEVAQAILRAVRDAGAPASLTEAMPLLDSFIRQGHLREAYSLWLSFLRGDELSNLGFLTNGDFEAEPSGAPFDWRIAKAENAVAEITAVGNDNNRKLHIAFLDGRVNFPEVRQVLLLDPGRYRIEGQIRGNIVAKRGIRWQLRCLRRQEAHSIAETDMFIGLSAQWRQFSLDFAFKETDECDGLILRLFHDARSASEMFISGQVWFDNLRIMPSPQGTAE